LNSLSIENVFKMMKKIKDDLSSGINIVFKNNNFSISVSVSNNLSFFFLITNITYNIIY